MLTGLNARGDVAKSKVYCLEDSNDAGLEMLIENKCSAGDNGNWSKRFYSTRTGNSL
jgi:hypothetical protein